MTARRTRGLRWAAVLVAGAACAAADDFGVQPITGGLPADRPPELAAPSLARSEGLLLVTLRTSLGGSAAPLPSYRVTLEGHPARLRIAWGPLARSEQLGWTPVEGPAARLVHGVFVAQSPDGRETWVDFYLRRGAVFRARAPSPEQLLIELRAEEAPTPPSRWAIYLAPGDSAARTFAWIEALTDADLEPQIILDAAGWFRVRAATFPTRAEAKAVAQRLARLDGLEGASPIAVEQPAFGRPRLPR